MIKNELIKELLKSQPRNENDLASFKRKIAKKYKIACPSNINLLELYHSLLKLKRIKKNRNLEILFKKRRVRSLSGVVVVSVLTKPYPCPGRCIYCPEEKGIPKSYLSGEPAVERAKKLNFDPYLQVRKRIEALEKEGHPTDKIELRVIGGSFSVYPEKYKMWFVTRCFAACNTKLTRKIKSLKEEQKLNEKASHRIVGMSIETRPDLITKEEIKRLRDFGVTMVEIGVQTIFDDILKQCQRGHGVKETTRATKLLKDAGFKIMYQMMPNLPGSNLKRDFECFKKIFQNPDFKPDWLKIYPCVVCKESKLFQIWKRGEYKPYSDRELIDLLTCIKKILPYWVRIARLFRDIPASKIKAGSKISNLREVVLKKLKKRGERCRCIRCREVKANYNPREKIYLQREDYEASDGKEIFLSFENKEKTKLLSFLRLRIPSQVFLKEKHFLPYLQDSAIIREIHTYGELVPFNKKIKVAPQHRGLGKKLIQKAENITKREFNLPKIAVISGVGVRIYWQRLGYKLKESYMVKKI
jgi:elongator complex protein 3